MGSRYEIWALSSISILEFASEYALKTTLTDSLEKTDPKNTNVKVSVRHILAALLLFDQYGRELNPISLLNEISFDLEAFKEKYLEFIKEAVNDNIEAWEKILFRSLKRGKVGDDKKTFLSGFNADVTSGRDLLDIERDVNALSSLVAAYSIEPLLSIGLFGDWGSGKSFFMCKMRERVEFLSNEARKSSKKQREIGYYKNIIQIEFNAWHYIEGNLWASLVEHIFSNLKLHGKEDPSIVEERRKNLFEQLRIREELKSILIIKI